MLKHGASLSTASDVGEEPIHLAARTGKGVTLAACQGLACTLYMYNNLTVILHDNYNSISSVP